jgi:hypothetical protein
MTQKNRFLKSAGVGLMLSAIVLAVYSCIDPLYDLSNGVSMDMELGGDSLAIPIGSTDTIMLKDYLDKVTNDMLISMENGGYAISIKDSIKQPIDAIDQSKLKIADQIQSINKPVNFGDLTLDKFNIPGVSKSTNVNMGLSTYSLGNFAIPSISSSTTANAGMSGYALTTPAINDVNVNANQMNLLTGITLPPDPGGSPVELPIADQAPVTVNTNSDINYSVNVPDGVTNIDNIELKSGAVFEVSIELSGASSTLTSGALVPDFTIDPKDLFKFTGMPAGTKITFANGDSMTKANGYKISKSLPISKINISGNPVAGKLQITKNILASGSMGLKSAIVRSDRLVQVGDMDLLVTVSVKNVEINSMEFDIPTLNANIPSSSTSLNINNSIPDQIQKLNKVLFNDPATITINLSTENMPAMDSSVIKIKNLAINFPEQFVFEPTAGLVNNTYTISNETFEPSGRTIQLTLKELNMSNIPVNGGVLSWNGNISYSGQVSFGGRINSKNIPSSGSDAKMKVQFGSSISFKSAEVTTNKISVSVPTVDLTIPLSTKISDQVKSLGVIKMKPNTQIRVDLTKPSLPLTFSANNLQVTFPSEFSFNPPLVANKLVLNGALEDSIVLILDALNINKELDGDTLNLDAKISVSGGIDLLPGVVNSTEIESLTGKTMAVKVSTSAIGISSTSIQLKDLAYNSSDSIPLQFEVSDVPTLLTSLDSVILKDNATINLSVNITNMPNFGAPLNVDLVVNFPDMLMFGPNEVNASNQMVLHESIVDGKLNKTIKLRGLKFDGSDLNGVLKIDKQLKYSAGVSVNSPTVNSDELVGKTINIAVEAKIANIAFKSIYGELNPPGLEPTSSTIPLDSIYKAMKDNNVDAVLDVTKPVIEIRTESNLGIPIDASVVLTPKIGNNPISEGIQSFSVKIPKSPRAEDILKKTYWISPDSAGMPTGSAFIKTDVQKLFRTIPQNIDMNATIAVDKTQQHFFDLTAAYNFKLFYDVTVPLAFGEDLKITITKDLVGIDPAIGEKAVAVKGIDVLGTIQNSIPLELELAVIPLDEDNNRIPIDTVKQIISAGAKDGSAVTSKLTLKLKDPNGLLVDLRGFRLIFKASSNETVAGTPIKSRNFVKADLKVRVDGGINLEKVLNN